MIGDTWSPTASMKTLNHLFSCFSKHKSIVQQLDFIGAFLQDNVKHSFFVNLDSRYGEYFPEYANYFGRLLSLKKQIFGIAHSGKLFSDELTNLLIDEADFNHSKCQMSVYYKYAPYSSNLVGLS